MEKLSMNYWFLTGNGNRLRRLNKAFHDVLQYIDRIYFPEEYEYEKRVQEFMKKRSSAKGHGSNKIMH